MGTQDVVIVERVRTPFGKFQGGLSQFSAHQLAVEGVRGLLKKRQESVDFFSPERISLEVLLGNVLTAGQGQAPARRVVIGSGLSSAIPAMTLNKVCGSGLQAIAWGAQLIACGEREGVLAGGMESMSQAPYLLPQARAGFRLGHQQILDSLLWDGLLDPHFNQAMGLLAERCAREKKISRQEQDDYALESFERAQAAQKQGRWNDELLSLGGLSEDEGITRLKKDSFRQLKPAFDSQGTITAANASSLSDGAAILFLASAEKAKQEGWKPLARCVAFATHSQEPEWFTTAPMGAIQKAIQKAGWRLNQVDLFEINEAFAMVPLAVQRALEIPRAKINPGGGAIAIGHPLGASGARVLMALISNLKFQGLRRGVASLCIGGGEGIAACVELME